MLAVRSPLAPVLRVFDREREFEMVGIDACFDPTLVVDVVGFRDGTDEEDVTGSVCVPLNDTPARANTELTVTGWGDIPPPKPTTGGVFDGLLE